MQTGLQLFKVKMPYIIGRVLHVDLVLDVQLVLVLDPPSQEDGESNFELRGTCVGGRWVKGQ